MTELDMDRAKSTTPSFRLTDAETAIDMARLRGWRLARVRAQLEEQGYGGCLLFDPVNARYACGARNHTLFHTHIIGRHLFVPTEGPVILFDGAPERLPARHLETVSECRELPPINFFFGGPRVGEWVAKWADEMAALVARHCGKGEPLGIDQAAPHVMAALQERGLRLVDAQAPMERARAIKSPEEILCMNFSITAAEVGFARMREALRAGMTENELWSLLHQANIAMGGEWFDGRMLSSGDRTNPWQQECSDRVIRPGELVVFDTDMIGPFGYCADVSRTYRCGPGKPTDTQRGLYKMAFEELHHNLELITPGRGFLELSEKAWRHPDAYVANRYPVVAHGVGMCDEYPAIYPLRDSKQIGYDGVIEENMVLCVESYIGAEGGHEGVKLEQQVLVTASGPHLLSRFPFEDELLN